MPLINLLIVLILLGFILWLVVWATDQIPMLQPFKVAVRVVIALIAILILLDLLVGNGLYLGTSTGLLRRC